MEKQTAVLRDSVPSFKGDILNASMTLDEYMLTSAFVRSDVVRQH